MRSRTSLLGAILAAVALAGPASAVDFSLFGSYWDTDVAGETGGGGIALGVPANETLALELRASYFEELTDDPLQNAFESDAQAFEDQGIQVLPVELGLRIQFAPGASFRPYLAGGGSYFLLDSDFGEISDELGYYAALGATIGDAEGADFFVEGIWRKATATIELDPEELSDVDDLAVEDHAEIDIDGLGVNLGVRWRF